MRKICFPRQHRLLVLPILLAAVTLIGCGRSQTVSNEPAPPAATPDTVTVRRVELDTTSPKSESPAIVRRIDLEMPASTSAKSVEIAANDDAPSVSSTQPSPVTTTYEPYIPPETPTEVAVVPTVTVTALPAPLAVMPQIVEPAPTTTLLIEPPPVEIQPQPTLFVAPPKSNAEIPTVAVPVAIASPLPPPVPPQEFAAAPIIIWFVQPPPQPQVVYSYQWSTTFPMYPLPVTLPPVFVPQAQPPISPRWQFRR